MIPYREHTRSETSFLTYYRTPSERKQWCENECRAARRKARRRLDFFKEMSGTPDADSVGLLGLAFRLVLVSLLGVRQ